MRRQIADRLPRAASRISGIRADHALLAVGGALMAVGSVLPWIRGSTRLNGYLDWTGLDDTGEGAMLIGAVVLLAIWVRWRRNWEELGSRARLAPFVILVACALLWLIAFRKTLYLSWFELAVGARPQPGLLIAGLGVVVALAGSVLVALDPAGLTGGPGSARDDRRRSGAGGEGTASGRIQRGGGAPPDPDEYSVVARVDRLSGRDDDEGGGGPARG